MKISSKSIKLGEGDSSFTSEVKARSGQNPSRCMQCGKCTAGCPVGFSADLPVNAVLRLVQEGLRDEVLGSRFIWLCAQCRTCSVRCPQEIDVAALMGTLRTMAWKGGHVADKRVKVFLGAFVDSVRKHGRVHELGLMMEYALRTGRLFDELELAPKALGKLSLRPHASLGADEVCAIVERAMKKGEDR
ncbi:MAG: 4Fe-4S dicluster domain-containing protein [Proteobacteria bacterium]|nr:4Fe-4S dicluster domain-containing protein [Pseudomonadota bacterium]